jgi:hypothetical protein
MKPLGSIPLDRFLMKFDICLFFEKPVDENSSFIKTDQNNGTINEDRFVCIYKNIALHFFNEKFCGKNLQRKSKHTFCVAVICPPPLPPENRAVYEIMWKNIVERGRPEMAIWRMRVA